MQAIKSEKAPQAIGAYSQAIRSGNLIFLSGQIPLCPTTMELCSEEIQAQIRQVFENLAAVCKACGGSFAEIVKLTVYLTNLSYAPLVNEAMDRYFTEPFPARAMVGVSALPRGSQVEIEGIMVLSS